MPQEVWNAKRRAFRLIAEDAPIIIWLTLPTGYCFYLNTAWTQFTGQTMDAALGGGWVQAIHPEDQAAAYEAYFTACAEGADYRIDYRMQHRDGGYRTVTALARRHFDENGKLDCYIGAIAQAVERPCPVNGLLSARERDMLQLIAEGLTSEEIADRLDIGVRTVSQYLSSAMQKLDAPNRTAALVKAIRNGLIKI